MKKVYDFSDDHAQEYKIANTISLSIVILLAIAKMTSLLDISWWVVFVPILAYIGVFALVTLIYIISLIIVYFK